MADLVAIDPGYGRRTEGCACAVFRQNAMGQHLLAAVLTVRPDGCARAIGDQYDSANVVLERPQSDRRSQGVGRDGTPAEVLIQLALQGGIVAGMFAAPRGAVRAVTPSEWKGSLQKPIHHKRALAALTPAELELAGGMATLNLVLVAVEKGARDRWHKPGHAYYTPSTKVLTDKLDAIALGLWALGRLAR